MTRTITIACAFLVSCGGDPASHPRDGAAREGGEATGDPATRICDGSAGVRLAIRVSGGGPTGPGNSMLAENGWLFLLVDGACHAWVLATHNDALRDVTLSREREEALSRALRLPEWNSLAGQNQGGGCSDAAGMSYRFDQLRFTGPACGVTPGSLLEALNLAFDAQVKQLYAEATPSSGDMRYLLIRDDDSLMLNNRAPVAWPLSVPAASVAISREQSFQFMLGRSQRAAGDDAGKLRAIRVPPTPDAFGTIITSTPVVDADGVRFALYARDAAPFESDNGLIPDDVF